MKRSGQEILENKFQGDGSINESHKSHLKETSCISECTIQEAFLQSSDPHASKDLFDLKASGIIFPYFNFQSELIGTRLRLDSPIKTADKNEIRYFQRKGSSLSCYFLKSSIPRLLDASIPLVVTEGEKKLLAIESNLGKPLQAVASYPGCWNFKIKDQRRLTEAWSKLIVPGRTIIFIPDSDYFMNPNVCRAGDLFMQLVLEAGARISLIDIRDLSDIKVGADDFIAKYGAEALAEKINTPLWFFSNPRVDLLNNQIDFESLNKILREWVLFPVEALESSFDSIVKLNVGYSHAELKYTFLRCKKDWNAHKPEAGNASYDSHEDQIILNGHIPRRQILSQITKFLKKDGRFYIYAKQLLFINKEEKSVVMPEALPGKLNYLGLEFCRNSQDGSLCNFQLLPPALASALFHGEDLHHNLNEVIIFVDHPTFDSEWRLVKPGYNNKEKIYFIGESIRPSSSLDFINEITKDFLFQSEASRCNFIGILLTSILRNKFLGDKPLTTMTGNRPGIGKSLACKVVGLIADGKIPESASYHSNPEEFEKQIGARISERDILMIDNVKSKGPLDSMVLERLTTDPVISFRKLGTSTTITRSNTIITFVSMNDAKFCRDLISRALPIQFYLDDSFDPSQNRFSHDSLLEFVRDHRGDILAELCGMIERWVAAGMPKATKQFRFRAWAQEIGGILAVSGFNEFLNNLEGATAEYDQGSNEIGLLFCNSLGVPLKAEELVNICKSEELLPEVQYARRPPAVLSNHLKRYVNKKLPLPGGGHFILKDGPTDRHNKVKTYMAERCDESIVANFAGSAGSGCRVNTDEARILSNCNNTGSSLVAGKAGLQTGPVLSVVQCNPLSQPGPDEQNLPLAPGASHCLKPALPARPSNSLVIKGDSEAGMNAGALTKQTSTGINSTQICNVNPGNELEW